MYVCGKVLSLCVCVLYTYVYVCMWHKQAGVLVGHPSMCFVLF